MPLSPGKGVPVFLRRLVCLSVVLCAVSLAPARAAAISAAELLDARLDYTADFSVSSGLKGSYAGRVIHAPGRERREFDGMGGREILLLRRDIDEATVMWPERRMYVSTSFSQLSGMVGGIEEMMLERRKSGAETLGGEACTVYDVTGSSSQGGSFRGKMWMTQDGILMKAKGSVRFNGKDTAVETGLAHLQRIKSDPQAFTRPADYMGMPINLKALGLSH